MIIWNPLVRQQQRRRGLRCVFMWIILIYEIKKLPFHEFQITMITISNHQFSLNSIIFLFIWNVATWGAVIIADRWSSYKISYDLYSDERFSYVQCQHNISCSTFMERPTTTTATITTNIHLHCPAWFVAELDFCYPWHVFSHCPTYFIRTHTHTHRVNGEGSNAISVGACSMYLAFFLSAISFWEVFSSSMNKHCTRKYVYRNYGIFIEEKLASRSIVGLEFLFRLSSTISYTRTHTSPFNLELCDTDFGVFFFFRFSHLHGWQIEWITSLIDKVYA